MATGVQRLTQHWIDSRDAALVIVPYPPRGRIQQIASLDEEEHHLTFHEPLGSMHHFGKEERWRNRGMCGLLATG